MNKELIKQIIKAKRSGYEAIKEALPDKVKERLESFEKETVEVFKNIAIEIMKEDIDNQNKDTNKKAKKVNVDFS